MWGGASQDGWGSQGGWNTQGGQETNSLGKGGKGKGKKGQYGKGYTPKGKGKGGPYGKSGPRTYTVPFYSDCSQCGIKGHSKGNCPSLGKGFKGACNHCKLIGHPETLCPAKYPNKGKGKGINELDNGTEEWDQCGNQESEQWNVEHEQEEGYDCNGYDCNGVWLGAVEIDNEGNGWELVKGKSWKKRGKKAKDIHHVERGGDGNMYEKVVVTIDSGAAENVAPVDTAPNVALQETQASKAGATYRVLIANGTPIRNMGMKTIQGITDNGTPLSFNTQITGVTKVLNSVSRMTAAGNKVVFDDEEGDYILNKRIGKITPMRKCDGTYKVDVWMSKAGHVPSKRIQEIRRGMEECPGTGWEQVTKETAINPSQIGLWHKKASQELNLLASGFPRPDEGLM